MPREQRTSKGMEMRMHGPRENTTMLYLGPPTTHYVSPRKQVKIPGIPDHTDNTTVDFIMSSHREVNREKQRKAIQNNEEFKLLQEQKAKRIEEEQHQRQMNQAMQDIYDGRGMKVNPEPVYVTPRRDEDERNSFFANFGKPGAGAPQRTNSGNIRTGLRTDAALRMNNGKVAAVETDRLRKLEKTNGLNNSFNSSGNGLSARFGYQEEEYNPWGRGAGNPNRDSAGMCRGMKRTEIGRGVYVPTDIHAGTGLVTESKYGGGGGQPRKGPNGELITTRQSHFSKDAQGNDKIKSYAVTKDGDPFGGDNGTLANRGGTFALLSDITATSDDYKRSSDSPLEKEAKERREKRDQLKRIEQML